LSDIQQSILNKNRKDKFLLVLNLPDALKKIDKSGQNTRDSEYLNFDTLQYSVHGTVVPVTTVLSTTLAYAGQNLNLTTGKREPYSEVSVNFTVDNSYNNWWVLWKWLGFINNAKTSTLDNEDLVKFASMNTAANTKFLFTSTGNLQPYQTNITVYGLDEYNNKKIQWNYSKAFITKLDGINYSYRDPDLIESSFTFSFSQLVAELL
jgi:hypothetical protein